MSIWSAFAGSSAARSSRRCSPTRPSPTGMSRSLANSAPASRRAALLLAALTGIVAASPAEAETNPQAALARAKQWSNSGGGFDADHCVAMALYDMKQYAEAARAFEKLARSMTNEGLTDQARIFDQAGQAWLVAEQPRSAKSAFDAALRLTPNDPDL